MIVLAQFSLALAADPKPVTFAAAGDTMMGSDLRKGAAGLAPGEGESLFPALGGYFTGADIAFLNLEGPLADELPSTKCAPGSENCHAFRTPVRFARALLGLGIDVASLANNHAMDLGSAGMDSTMHTLDALGIAHAGRTGDVARIERNGLKIAVLAAHSGACCLNINQVDGVVAAVKEADLWADLVVVSFHGGAEGSDHRHVPGEVELAWGEARGDVKLLARAAIDAGADLVLGHGPHVLRAMEVYHHRLVAYSLGNFCGFRQFGTGGGPSGRSVVLQASLAPTGELLDAHLVPLALDSEGKPTLDPIGAAWSDIASLSAADFPETGVKVGKDGALSW